MKNKMDILNGELFVSDDDRKYLEIVEKEVLRIEKIKMEKNKK